jgi:hypothetical protein
VPPAPAPTLTLGPVPARAGTGNATTRNAGNSTPLGKIAGLVLLAVGIALGGGFCLRTILTRRRTRWVHVY